jgi:hypothetical protein
MILKVFIEGLDNNLLMRAPGHKRGTKSGELAVAGFVESYRYRNGIFGPSG